jgi:hypothetical protein
MGFIFTEDNIKSIIRGDKTQTRRPEKPNELFIPNYRGEGDAVVTCYADDARGDIKYRLKWQVGRDYKVIAGRTLGSAYYRMNDDGKIELAHTTWMYVTSVLGYARLESTLNTTWQTVLENMGWQPLSYRITSLRSEPLQDISKQDAIAEGVSPASSRSPVLNFIDTWNMLHKKTGNGGDTNPSVWVIGIERIG